MGKPEVRDRKGNVLFCYQTGYLLRQQTRHGNMVLINFNVIVEHNRSFLLISRVYLDPLSLKAIV